MRRGGWGGTILVIVLVLVLLLSLSSVFSEHEADLLPGQERWSPQMVPEPGKETNTKEEPAASDAEKEEPEEERADFEIHFLDVGQGDAALVLCDGHAMMIDGGKAADSQLTYAYLAQREIDHLDYVVCTHPHDDHAGGLAGALNYATADVALCPVTEYDTVAFRNFTKYLDRQGVALTVPAAGDVFRLGSAEVTVLGPTGEYEIVNDGCIVLKIEYGETSFLFTADAELGEEQALLAAGGDLRSTVLKVGHHGGETSTSEEFLRAVAPEYAVISVGKNNGYGHPSEGVLGRLKDAGVELYRTDLQGTVICTSDGKAVTFRTERKTDKDSFEHPGVMILPEPVDPVDPGEKTDGTDGEVAPEPDQPNGTEEEKTVRERTYTYILNTNTYVFHEPYCPSVSQMSEKNKQVYEGTRDEIIAMGFRPCERCYP